MKTCDQKRGLVIVMHSNFNQTTLVLGRPDSIDKSTDIFGIPLYIDKKNSQVKFHYNSALPIVLLLKKKKTKIINQLLFKYQLFLV